MTSTPAHLAAVLVALDDPSSGLQALSAPAGATLLAQGGPSDSFMVLVEGTARVSLDDDAAGPRRVADLGPGEVIGEVGLLTGRPRGATVRATSPVRAVRGDAHAFAALMDRDDVHDALVQLARRRVAEDLAPIEVAGPVPVALRPLLVTDREALVEAVRAASADTLQRRFLSGGLPTRRMIDYLVNVNYVDHFAWVALDEDHDADPTGVGRYVRLRADPAAAELAFTVRDGDQGRGIGTLLLGALGAIAPDAGLERFTATMRADNHAMRAVLAKAGARFSRDEPGVSRADLDVEGAAALLDPDSTDRLRRAARNLVTLRG